MIEYAIELIVITIGIDKKELINNLMMYQKGK